MINSLQKKIILLIIFFLFLIFLFIFQKFMFQEKKINIPSLKYEEIIQKIDVKKPNQLKKIQKFIINNKNIYGVLASMHLSKKYIIFHDLENALITLKNGMKYITDNNLKNILKIRIAQIKIQKNENQDAIDLLNTITNKNWENIIENMKGDIFMKKNNIKEALKSFQKSFSNEKSHASKEIIKMKIDEFQEEK